MGILWKQFLTPVENMEPDEARDYIRNRQEGTFTLLDVRQLKEYERERIPGATLIPVPELPGRLQELDPDKPTIVY